MQGAHSPLFAAAVDGKIVLRQSGFEQGIRSDMAFNVVAATDTFIAF
jgi:hypothetical protein